MKYQALLDGDVDIVVAFGTDGAIVADDLVVMRRRQASLPALSRRARRARAPRSPRIRQIATALDRLAPLLTDDVMRGLNDQIDGAQKREPADVARDFIKAHGLA